VKSNIVLFCLNTIANSTLSRTLTQFCNICTREFVRNISKMFILDIRCNWGFSKGCLKNVLTSTFIRQGDVDKLIETARSNQSLIEDIRSICGTNEKEILLGACTIHLSQQLIQYAVSCTRVSLTCASSTTYGVQFIEEEHTWSCTSCFIEDFSYVGFRLTKPHS